MKRIIRCWLTALLPGIVCFSFLQSSFAVVKTVEINDVTVSVQAIGNVYVRTGPGKDYPVMTIMKKGQALPSSVADGDYTIVRVEGKEGYALTKYVKEAKPEPGVAKIVKAVLEADILNGPSIYAKKKDKAREGEIYELLGETTDYYIISYNNDKAFVDKLMFQSFSQAFEGQSGDIGAHVFVPSAGRQYMECKNKTTVYASPSKGATALGTIYEGSILPVLGNSKDYICIDYNNGMGYVIATDLQQSSFRVEQTVKESIYEEAAREFIIYINDFRLENGKQEFVIDRVLMEAARIRAKEISQQYGHIRPDGTMFNSLAPGVIFGENIAHGSALPTALSAAKGFMSSNDHRDNLLDERNTKTGAACYNVNGDIYWVQLFG